MSDNQTALEAFVPHDHQRSVLLCPKRFIACICGAQAGKTTVGAVWLLREIYESYSRGERHDWLISAPTAKVLGQSTLPKFNAFFPADWGEYKENKQCYDLVWGNKIYVRSGEEPDHIEGMTIKGAWFDEPGQMKPQMWINVQARLAVNRGRMILTSTPYEFNWFWRDVEMRAGTLNDVEQTGDHRDPELAVFKWKSVDSPYFPKEEYDRARKIMSAEMFAQRYDGTFTRREGLVFKDFNRQKHVLPAFPIPGEWRRFAGLDFGSDHPMAVVCVAQEPEIKADKEKGIEFRPSRFYIYKEFYKRKALLSELAVFLQNEPLAYTMCDPRGATERDELTRFHGTRRLFVADNTVDMGLERIKQLFREDRLFFLEGRTPNTLDELESYRYQLYTPDKVGKDEPIKTHDDAMDALRYGFSRIPEGMFPVQSTRIDRIKAQVKLRTADRKMWATVSDITGY